MRARIIGAAVLVGAALAVVASTASGGTQAASSITVWLQTDAQATNWEPIVKAANAAFQKDHPGVAVNVQYQTWGNHLQKFDATLAGGSTPDVIEMGNTEMTKYMAAGAFQDLTSEKGSLPNSGTWLEGLAASGRYGGMFSGCTPDQVESLHRFGAAIGTAFQISDDIIDITSPSTSSGKTPGTDLREGVLTLPMLYALQDTGASVDRLRVLLARPITDDAEVAEALDLLRTGPGVARAEEVLAEHASAARKELAQLPDCSAATALSSLTTYVVARTA